MPSRPTKKKTPAAPTAGVPSAETKRINERTKPMNSKPRSKTALAFQSTAFEVVDHDGEPWLRSPQIGGALGYVKGADSIDKLYKSNADEFTEHMTAVIDLPTAGGVQKVRIFSLRGAHMLGMLAKTENAKAFRQWVLDILEGAIAPQETGRMTYPQRLAYLKERRSLVRELGSCTEAGMAGELYDNLAHVSRLLGITPRTLVALAPGLKQRKLSLEGGATCQP
jgi:prophage antirepressor-like protein